MKGEFRVDSTDGNLHLLTVPACVLALDLQQEEARRIIPARSRRWKMSVVSPLGEDRSIKATAAAAAAVAVAATQDHRRKGEGVEMVWWRGENSEKGGENRVSAPP